MLSDDEIAARIDATRQGGGTLAGVPTPQGLPMRWGVPMSASADSLLELLRNEDGRWLFGIPDLDVLVRGVGRGELMYLTGRSHSGKTQVLLQSIVNNGDKRVLLFTPDETSELVLAKLVSMITGLSVEKLEADVRAGDTETIEKLRAVAADRFSNLVVVEQSLTFDRMGEALNDARQWWGAEPDLVAVDFLDLLPGDGETGGTINKSQGMKRWAIDADCPVICIHQARKTGADRGKKLGMDDMRYAGDTEAFYVLAVYRKCQDPSLSDDDAAYWDRTITVNVSKNKRPPSRTGVVDLFIDGDCGFIRPLRDGDLRRPSARRDVDDLARAWVQQEAF